MLVLGLSAGGIVLSGGSLAHGSNSSGLVVGGLAGSSNSSSTLIIGGVTDGGGSRI